ncbi:MAG: hypothetical protein Edafosvirus43_5 [Edafosvirus sp.]|uniref:Uncharacterized protein n=1 Tax=Edafosvirus sp. TaxID=2487765 RepID=A0A3G4ZX20_9VIRU|nr:MAG: hypothetical protein Edafosvirus43_5 [Edafosvirus sp.]
MACSPSAISIISPLVSFLDDDICTDKIHESIVTMNNEKFKIVIDLLCDQKNIDEKDLTYSLYKIGYYDNIFKHHLDSIPEENNLYLNELTASDQFLLLNIISPMSLMDCILKHANKRYIFLPLSMNVLSKDAGHMTCLAVDVSKKHLYLIDPNGSSSYFNNMFNEMLKNNLKKEKNIPDEIKLDELLDDSIYFDVSMLVDDLFVGYCKELEKCGFKYTFIPSSKWNSKQYHINKSVNNAIIKNGHCLITSVMIAQYMNLTNSEPSEVYELFAQLTDDELLNFINGYTMWIYKMLF